MKPGSKALTELTGTEEKPQQGALVYYLCKAGPKCSHRENFTQNENKKSSYVHEAKQASEDLYYTDLLLYICLCLFTVCKGI